MAKFKQGYYKVINREKYIGDIDKVFYRSSYELKFMIWCDNQPSVLRWNSEELIVPYIKPTDKRQHRYMVDFYIEYKNTKNQIIKEAIEIKPHAQTKPPRRSKGKSGLYQQVTYAINVAKWQAAAKWCKKRGVTFRLITEKQLFK